MTSFSCNCLTSPFKDPHHGHIVTGDLDELHRDFVLCPIDKTANNTAAIICKRFYINVILKELGLNGPPSPTYEIVNRNFDFVIKQQEQTLKTKYKIYNIPSDCKILPKIYWTPKMHKNPIGARFIIAGKKCINKQLSKHVTSAFRLCFNQTEAYYKKTHYFSGVKSFWVTQNNQAILDNIERINKRKKARQISTFDFSTLYTKIPHDNLIEVLHSIIDFVFKGGTRDSIIVNTLGIASWSQSKAKSSFAFSKSLLKDAVTFLINNSYFSFGNMVMKQNIGIPMGSDPAPFFANLYLASYEIAWVREQKKTGEINMRLLNFSCRFIDDLETMNDNDIFEENFHLIYPKELILKKENTSKSSATFLDLQISIDDGMFQTRLFDKREDFGFHIVRMPFLSSNIPKRMFYGAISAEFLRISRVTSKFIDLKNSTRQLVSRMQEQEATLKDMKISLNKIIKRHNHVFDKYDMPNKQLLTEIGFQ